MKITLFTSGSTSHPKQVTHEDLLPHIKRSVEEIGLRKDDIVLDVFPANVIAHYTVTAQPAIMVGAHLVSFNFDPYTYIRLFKEYQPTYIALIPRHVEILNKTKEWANLDMSCVRYMVTGSSTVSQQTIDALRSRGVATVANWYGMTEMHHPVFVGYNSESFDFSPRTGYDVEFTDAGECVINGIHTGDLFDLDTKQFIKRMTPPNGQTWKSIV